MKNVVPTGIRGTMLTVVLQYVFLGIYVTSFVGTTRLSDAVGGFSVSRVPSLNMFALQCNGSHLPSEARSVMHMSLERHSLANDGLPYVIASLSVSDGPRLENSQGDANVYVSGVINEDSVQATYLSVLFTDLKIESDVTYACTITFTVRGGRPGLVERLLNVTSVDLQNMHRVDTVEPKSVEPPVVASSQSNDESKPLWTTPMIMLIAMAGLLFLLFIICLLLVIERYRDNRRRRRLERMTKKKSVSKEKGLDHADRPLPPPPSWAYPQVPGAPPQRSPYHRLRMGSVGRNLPDDTGYDSDASMSYCRPYDDLGEIIQDKPNMETFGKQLAPIYATSPMMATS